MAISLYDASVACYLQTLDAVNGFLEKGLSYAHDNGIDPEEIVETRIYPDMHPFRFQIQQVVRHSAGAVEAMRSGSFFPPRGKATDNYATLQQLVADAATTLRVVTREEIDALEGRDVIFEAGETRRHFTTDGFVLSFSLPNFHFHAATAYDILRSKGVPVGKRDFMGAVRLKA